jgi:hypothetical protein
MNCVLRISTIFFRWSALQELYSSLFLLFNKFSCTNPEVTFSALCRHYSIISRQLSSFFTNRRHFLTKRSRITAKYFELFMLHFNSNAP